MAAFSHILVGVDFSENSAVAVRQAMRLAVRDGAQVTVAHVVGSFVPPEVWPDLWSMPTPQSSQQVLKVTREHMSAWLEPLCDPDVTVDCEVIPGMPVEALDDLAQGRGCDLLMITATGKGALERFFLGSTAEGLARRAQTPLWVVRNPQAGACRRVVVGVDYNPTSREALHAALVQAHRDKAELDVVHTWRDPGRDAAFSLASPEDQERYRSQEVQREQESFSKICLDVLPRTLEHGPTPGMHLLAGKPSAVLVQFADEHHADLLVVGHRDHNLLRELLMGSTSERVLRSAHCDVLVVRPPEQGQ